MKHIINVCLLVAMLATTSTTVAQAQDYPNRPIRIILATTPGGMLDPFGRLIGDGLQQAMGQPVLMEHKPGAGGMLGGDLVAASKPDGYTIWLGSVGPLALLPAFGKTTYDVDKDFTPVTLLLTTPNVLVVPVTLPVQSISELVALAKNTQGGLSYASGGVGTSFHLAGELFRASTGANITHIPYKGTAVAVADLIAGRVQFMFSNVSSVLAHINAGQLRPLAVTAPKRLALLPQVATTDEIGMKGFYTGGFLAIMAPAHTPEAIVRRLNLEINKIMTSEVGRKTVAAHAGDDATGSPEDLAKYLRTERAIWSKVIADNAIPFEF
ncbi:MAG: Bug family tripartite tricarboxylate transporter substrate binding protein [Reyranellaceae bacterium]